jgi:hypothetical protein
VPIASANASRLHSATEFHTGIREIRLDRGFINLKLRLFSQ